MAVLEVKNLKAYIFSERGTVKAVDDITFDLQRGEILGLAGESGCGKSTTAYALLNVLPEPGRIVNGSVILDGENLTQKSTIELQKIRWEEISMIFQNPRSALNPVLKVGDQIVEAIMLHEDTTPDDAWKLMEELLEVVGINPTLANNYPHEFTPGMTQRIMIALALVANPKILIADEPTAALDITVAVQLLRLLKNLQEYLRLSIILITNDLATIAEACDRVAIMYAGQIVELADVKTIFKEQLHPYTEGLIRSIPSLLGSENLVFIPGSPPDLLTPPSGCRFHSRCPIATTLCSKTQPKYREIKKGHFIACHHADQLWRKNVWK
ncbi:MAG: ABC transporter ATP-binding protein [Candidatus Odinarchaeota archaeon]